MKKACLIKSILIVALLFYMAAGGVFAQSGINSPYSRYGVGILSDRSTSFGKAMGGIGVGMRI